jgi:hypothetical protein
MILGYGVDPPAFAKTSGDHDGTNIAITPPVTQVPSIKGIHLDGWITALSWRSVSLISFAPHVYRASEEIEI